MQNAKKVVLRIIGPVNFSEDVLERFWKKVEIGTPEDCWLWTGARVGGYGSFTYLGGARKAHRISWGIRNGYIPESNLCVCHKCDTALCVNPDHFFLGTVAQNIADRDAKGRQRKYVRSDYTKENHKAKLTADQVMEIRKSFSERTETLQELSDRFRIHIRSVIMITTRRNWRNIP